MSLIEISRNVKCLVARVAAGPNAQTASINALLQSSARATRPGPTIAAAAAITVLGELPAARAASAAISAGSPTRFISAAMSTSSIARSSAPAMIVDQRQRKTRLDRLQRQIQHSMAMDARDLGLGIDRGRARLVLHRLSREDLADLALQSRRFATHKARPVEPGASAGFPGAAAPGRWPARS